LLDRSQSHNDDTGMWRALSCWKLAWIFLLFLCVGVISGCGTPSSPTTGVGQHPQPSVVAHPFHDMIKTLDGDFTIILDITPNRSGTNAFKASVIDTRTNTPATHITLTLYTTMQDMPMGTDSIILHAEGNGQFSATSNTLSMDGHWAIGITIQTCDHVVHKAGVSLLTSS
jgi:copper transport protein